jgi:hypothetical protein
MTSLRIPRMLGIAPLALIRRDQPPFIVGVNFDAGEYGGLAIGGADVVSCIRFEMSAGDRWIDLIRCGVGILLSGIPVHRARHALACGMSLGTLKRAPPGIAHPWPTSGRRSATP